MAIKRSTQPTLKRSAKPTPRPSPKQSLRRSTERSLPGLRAPTPRASPPHKQVRKDRGLVGMGLVRGKRLGQPAAWRHPVVERTGAVADPSACERCGNLYTRKKWQRPEKVSHALLVRAAWTLCPACAQERSGEAFGRVILRGSFVAANEEAIRQRIQNVAERAEFTQPQRRVMSIERTRVGALDVLTTSQKLAHRIAHELKKAFAGRVSYSWSDRDGSLLATWEREASEDKRPSSRRP